MASASERRKELREKLWPGSEARVWDRRANAGFTSIPRLLPLVMHLIKILSKKGDPSVTYLDLWARAFDEAVISISDEEAAAYSSGYSGTRAVRTWSERIETLRDLGFIEVKSSGNRKIAHILLLNPLIVCAELYKTDPDKIPQEWWTAFLARATEIGAKLPVDPVVTDEPDFESLLGLPETPKQEVNALQA